MAIIIILEALLYSASAVVELVDVDLSVLYYSSVDDSVSYL
jgi:hypothetical protein